MMKRSIALLALALLPTLANANLVVNGSFEADAQAAGTWNIYDNLAGWTGGRLGVELRNNVAGAASEGVNYVELDTTGNSSIYQFITTSAGTWYDLAFDYSPREGVAEASNQIKVWWGNDVLTTPPLKGFNAGPGNNWSTYTFKVQGTGNDKLFFDALGTNDSYGGSLDNIRVTAVPEPETYAMLLAGLGMIGFMSRRRKGN